MKKKIKYFSFDVTKQYFEAELKLFFFDDTASYQNDSWASAWQNQQNDLCASKDSPQSDQGLRWALTGKLRTQAFFMWTAKTLIRLPSLIWVFAGRTGHFVGFVMLWLNVKIVIKDNENCCSRQFHTKICYQQ